ncbi:response regulator transcription factor [Azospirillum sp. TSO35-2]|uniref:response regulator n=1 Tax=Azospirillum sp. TSO35-2 TaxID=716796 RepID=UPI000D616908|nr:response regulator transcription factor [Azospirillum sp. TSO35-2]PWC31272.1 chemotaxis protein CheY [Azospirillum sp. TSO35-2]
MAPDRRIRVMLVEDDAPIRERMAAILRGADALDLVAIAATLEQARELCAVHVPTVLVTDLKLPDGSGLDLIRDVRRLFPAMEIMVVSVLGDERSVLAAIEAGAAGYILKDSTSVDLVGSVLDLVAGLSPISTSIARTIVRRVQGTPPAANEPPPPALTEREIDILWGIAKGFTYGDIAERLGISRNTVMTHIKNIYRKLEVNSRGEAVFAAINHKIISIGG